MSAEPEVIASGLLAYLQAGIPKNFDASGVATFGRRLKFWSDVTVSRALFVRHIADEDVWEGRGLHATVMQFEVWLYVKTPGPDDISDTDLNTAVKLIRQAMAPSAFADENTLNGLVYSARIEGRSDYAPADDSDMPTGIVIIPVKVQMNSTYP